MQQIRSLIHFLEQGLSLRETSEKVGLSRQTVTSYATRLRQSGQDWASLRGLSDTELSALVYLPAVVPELVNADRRQDFMGRISYFQRELKRTGVTRLLLWEEYAKAYADPYRYTQFCILLREADRITRASMHLEHRPGAMMMVDFAGDKLSYVDKSTGEVVACPVLIIVLPFSKFSFAMALANASIPQLIKGLNACLHYFGGVPASLKTDNMKQVVTRSCRYEPQFSEVLLSWSQHYNVALQATRVAKPKDKGAVENEVKIAYQRIYAPLRNVVYSSLEALNRGVLDQLNLHNNKQLQLKEYSRRALFEQEERSLLQALPAIPFELKHQALAKVQKNYHITLGENYHHYSVPFHFIGKQVSVVYDADHVEIYFRHQRIALHRRSFKKHGFSTVGEHMPQGHQQFFEQQGWTPTYFLSQALRIGPHTHAYLDEVLKARTFTEQTYNACRGILRLQQGYGTDRLEAACHRALQGSVFNYRTVQNILINKLDLLSYAAQQSLFQLPDHTNLRGPQAYE